MMIAIRGLLYACPSLDVIKKEKKTRIIKNILTILRGKGQIIFPNGLAIKVDKENLRGVLQLYLFALKYNVDLLNEWKFDVEENILTTPSGIKFTLKGFDPTIFAETFLCLLYTSPSPRDS